MIHNIGSMSSERNDDDIIPEVDSSLRCLMSKIPPVAPSAWLLMLWDPTRWYSQFPLRYPSHMKSSICLASKVCIVPVSKNHGILCGHDFFLFLYKQNVLI